jgi:uncharacterized coiled-coil protein SlyX
MSIRVDERIKELELKNNMVMQRLQELEKQNKEQQSELERISKERDQYKKKYIDIKLKEIQENID